jgi:hypothetical protein
LGSPPSVDEEELHDEITRAPKVTSTASERMRINLSMAIHGLVLPHWRLIFPSAVMSHMALGR